MSLGAKLWEPDAARIARANFTSFAAWLAARTGRNFPDYESLRAWSVANLEDFWRALWDYFGLKSRIEPECVLTTRQMPGARWFPGARLNFAKHLLSCGDAQRPAVHFHSEAGPSGTLSWGDLNAQVLALARELKAIGVQPGDRVAGYLPTCPEAVVALLASTLIGAIWSCCSQDLGVSSVLDRFRQIEPRVLIAADGYRYGGKDFGRSTEVAALLAALPSLQSVIVVRHLPGAAPTGGNAALDWQTVLARGAERDDDPAADLDFDHPLWIVYTSGTTGPPKPLVHGHGGVLLEMLKQTHIHMDLRPTSCMFFYTTTGWIVFPVLVSALLAGGSIVLYDGAPAHPDFAVLWRITAERRVTHFGTSPSFVGLLKQNGFSHSSVLGPRALDALECVLCTGSPLTPESFVWIYQEVKRDLWVTSLSGGTDVVSALVGGLPTQPVHNGEIQVRCLGLAVESFDDDGHSVVDREGELVITQPMPSMPLRLWNDPDNRRYLDSYFNHYPGVWRHGDLLTITSRGTCIISGRSDATLNRHGVRIGSGEIYRALERMPQVLDALIVNLELSGGRFFMPLFVVLRPECRLDPDMTAAIADRLRTEQSPRHVPDRIYQVPAIPYTLTGKKMEVPVKRILAGADPARAANSDAMADPTALEYFVRFAREQADYRL